MLNGDKEGEYKCQVIVNVKINSKLLNANNHKNKLDFTSPEATGHDKQRSRRNLP